MKSILSSIDDLRDDFLHVKGSVIKALQEENHNLKSRLCQLEVDFMDSSNHCRRNNIVITGISPSIKANEFEPIAIKILVAVNVDVSTKEIHDVHRLHTDDEKSMPTIISFTNRKSAEDALAHRKLSKV